MKVWIKKISALLPRTDWAGSVLRQAITLFVLSFVGAVVIIGVSPLVGSVWLFALITTAAGLACNGVLSAIGVLVKKRFVQEMNKRRKSTA